MEANKSRSRRAENPAQRTDCHEHATTDHSEADDLQNVRNLAKRGDSDQHGYSWNDRRKQHGAAYPQYGDRPVVGHDGNDGLNEPLDYPLNDKEAYRQTSQMRDTSVSDISRCDREK